MSIDNPMASNKRQPNDQDDPRHISGRVFVQVPCFVEVVIKKSYQARSIQDMKDLAISETKEQVRNAVKNLPNISCEICEEGISVISVEED